MIWITWVLSFLPSPHSSISKKYEKNPLSLITFRQKLSQRDPSMLNVMYSFLYYLITYLNISVCISASNSALKYWCYKKIVSYPINRDPCESPTQWVEIKYEWVLLFLCTGSPLLTRFSNNKQTKSWKPFRSCLLNSTANPAQFGWKLAKIGWAI